jgi:hypothetical protein
VSVEEFIEGFFGEGNIAWPGRVPDSPRGQRMQPYLAVLRGRGSTQVPVVLPRRREIGAELTAYVIANDHAHAVVVADLLTAFVGPNYSDFDGLPARLDPTDPVDRAVLDFAGEGLTFKVCSPTESAQIEAWRALDLMQETVRQRPVRTWNVHRPPGQILGEFEVALAAGDGFTSASLLEQLSSTSGLGAANVLNLRIKRLARLGDDEGLLRLPGLADAVVAIPPAPIRDAILAAVYGARIAAPLDAGDLAGARLALFAEGQLVRALASGGGTGVADLESLGGEALAVVALLANIAEDTECLAAILLNPHRRGLVASVAPLLAETLTPAAVSPDTGATPAAAETVPAAMPGETELAVAAVSEPESAVSEPESAAPELASAAQDATAPESTVPGSWLELVTALSAGSADFAAILASQDWQEWDPPGDEDQAIADALASLGEREADRAWLLAGPIVSADGYERERPAAATARQLIEIALLNDRFNPGDLSGIVALADIVLRSNPDAADYAMLLGDLREQTRRWVGPERATTTLDLADLLVRAAPADKGARLLLAQELLRPLRERVGRLDSDQARFAQQLSGELETGLDWPELAQETAQDQDARPVAPAKILLYSLDEAVLSRVAEALKREIPGVDVRLSHLKAGSQTLRDQVRGSEVIVLAVRCAQHAATGFIRMHASAKAIVTEADGSGSASLYRAAMAALRLRSGS